jgi:hypothetical protein
MLIIFLMPFFIIIFCVIHQMMGLKKRYVDYWYEKNFKNFKISNITVVTKKNTKNFLDAIDFYSKKDSKDLSTKL